jgi:DNA-binding transcriptional ArsR family regulator
MFWQYRIKQPGSQWTCKEDPMEMEREPVDSRLTALRHPLRQRILKQLSAVGSSSSPKRISDMLGAPLSNVSYHVRILAKCEALELVDTRPVRGSMEHFYKPSEAFMADPGVVALLDLSA